MRNVRLATVSFLMNDAAHSVEENLARAAEYISDAASERADIVCLPETVTTNGTQLQPEDTLQAEDFPSTWTYHFQQLARKHAVHVIAPYLVQEGGRRYNQATVIDSQGSIVGWYRKVQPTGSEARTVTPGSLLPIFDLAFGRIAIMTCMDLYFPEIARIYAMKGAEILFWPTVAHGPTQSGLEAQLRSRAIDNSLWIVESNLACEPPYAPYADRFYPGNAKIVDHNGDIIAQTGRRGGIAVAQIDLDQERKTAQVVLISEEDDTRRDLEALARMDLYAREYDAIARTQQRFYDTL